jgi:hypothetical protein
MVETPAAGTAERRKARAVMPRRAVTACWESTSLPSWAVESGSRPHFFKACRGQRKGGKMLYTRIGKRLLLSGLLVMSGMATREAFAQTAVFLKCSYFNGRVERIMIDPNAKKAAFLNGGTFVLEVSESFYTLTTEFDFGASGGGVVDVETKINRRSQLLTSRIAGGKSGYFTQYPLGGTCSGDQPWPGTVF